MEHKTVHSKYKGFTIVKVVQDSGRVTYDILDSAGRPWEWALPTLKLAKVTIDCD